jgi:hypothetical protein
VRALLVAELLALSVACNPLTPNPPPAPLPLSPTAVYTELVEGGCYAPSDAGVAVVTQESQLSPPPAWYGCLVEGGTIAACGVPCQ